MNDALREKVLIRAPRGLPPKMVADYVDRYRSSLLALRDALERADYEQVRVFGHRLSGTAGAYGLPDATDMGAAMEQAAARKQKAELNAQTDALEAYLSRVEVVPD